MNEVFSVRMRAPEAARYLGISQSTLAKARCRGDGPPFMKIGMRVVVYDRVELDQWLAARRHQSTSEYS